MNKERTKVGDIRISKRAKKPIICTWVEYDATGNEDSTWASYEKNLLKLKMGMSPKSLQHFIDMFDANQPIEQIRDPIKIRYAYITSLTNVKEDPFYKENLAFKILTLNDLETSHDTLEDLLTLNTTTLIKILGRDLYTGRVDMDGKDIYEGDRIRRALGGGDCIDEAIHRTSLFDELHSAVDCRVIGTIYDKEGI
jgi:hypothetical protein